MSTEEFAEAISGCEVSYQGGFLFAWNRSHTVNVYAIEDGEVFATDIMSIGYSATDKAASPEQVADGIKNWLSEYAS